VPTGGGSTYGDSSSAFVFGGQGRINAWLSSDMTVQLDAEGEATTNIHTGSAGSGDDGRVGDTFAAHLSWRDPKSHLFGVFGGFAAENNLDYDGTMTFGIIGVEGQYYAGPVTLYGQAGLAPLMSDSKDYEPKGLWFLRAVGRYFVNRDDRLQAEFGYANASVNGHPGDFNIFNWGASWEHRYTGTPFSNSIEYIGFEQDRTSVPSSSSWAREHVIQVSFKIHFGDDSLEDQNHNGATLDTPNFRQAAAWSWWVGR